jgi:hypothetical protein
VSCSILGAGGLARTGAIPGFEPDACKDLVDAYGRFSTPSGRSQHPLANLLEDIARAVEICRRIIEQCASSAVENVHPTGKACPTPFVRRTILCGDQPVQQGKLPGACRNPRHRVSSVSLVYVSFQNDGLWRTGGDQCVQDPCKAFPVVQVVRPVAVGAVYLELEPFVVSIRVRARVLGRARRRELLCRPLAASHDQDEAARALVQSLQPYATSSVLHACRMRRSDIVIRKEDGVAGFFEDLPVLMFVLVGVSVLVMSAAWAQQESVDRELDSELDDVARRVAESVVASFRSDCGAVPRVASIEGKNLSPVVELPSGCHGCAATAAILHPNPSVLATYLEGDVGEVLRTGYSRILFNAVDDHGLILILEVRIIVWQDR